VKNKDSQDTQDSQNANNPRNETVGNRASNIINKAAKSRTRLVKFSVSNLVFLSVALIVGLLLFNVFTNPSLGEQVTVDTFVRNIKDNKYSRVDIRNDGNAVGLSKFVDIVDAPEVTIQSGGQTEVKTASNLEKKPVSDLVDLLKPATDPLGAIRQLFNFAPRNSIRELYILEDRVLVDWFDPARADWYLEKTSEVDLARELTANNIELATLPVRVTYARNAASLLQRSDFEEGVSNQRYSSIWQFGDRVVGRVSATKLSQSYINFGPATNDFTKFIQEEGVNLASSNVQFRVLPIYQLDLAFIINIFLVAGLLFTGYMLLRSVNGSNSGLMQFGKSKARMFFGQKMNVTFKDVAGVDEAKEELKEVVDFLRNPLKYTKLGAKIPRGVLMVGEPGTGKTLLARAVAGEAGVPFFHTSGSEFEEMLVGAGASRVRDLFDKAKKASPALIFIDEIDAVGRKRGTTIQSSSTEQTLNQILVEMDGFEVRDNVIVIAATNRPDVLDPALLRPGRFDRKVVLDAPDIEGRKAILLIHSKNKPLAEAVDLEKVARRTVGFSGADLANMINEAAIIVAKGDRKEITMDDIEEAATKVQSGPIRRRKRDQSELRMTAYHEAAHAIVMKRTPQSDPVHRITILSRGMALGYTMPLPETDQLQMTKTKMESKITSLLAGWISEELVFNDVTTGAANDIERATNIAQRMVKQFGMSKRLGLIKYGAGDEEPHIGWGGGNDKNYSEATAEIIDQEVQRIIQDSYDKAKQILIDERARLDKLAEMLLQDEVVEADKFLSLFN